MRPGAPVALVGAMTLLSAACTSGRSAVPVPFHERASRSSEKSTSEVLAYIDEAGLRAPHPRDFTEILCPKLGCISAMHTDTVSVLEFPTPADARSYTETVSNTDRIGELVLVFDLTLTSRQKSAYSAAVVQGR